MNILYAKGLEHLPSSARRSGVRHTAKVERKRGGARKGGRRVEPAGDDFGACKYGAACENENCRYSHPPPVEGAPDPGWDGGGFGPGRRKAVWLVYHATGTGYPEAGGTPLVLYAPDGVPARRGQIRREVPGPIMAGGRAVLPAAAVFAEAVLEDGTIMYAIQAGVRLPHVVSSHPGWIELDLDAPTDGETVGPLGHGRTRGDWGTHTSGRNTVVCRALMRRLLKEFSSSWIDGSLEAAGSAYLMRHCVLEPWDTEPWRSLFLDLVASLVSAAYARAAGLRPNVGVSGGPTKGPPLVLELFSAGTGPAGPWVVPTRAVDPVVLPVRPELEVIRATGVQVGPHATVRGRTLQYALGVTWDPRRPDRGRIPMWQTVGDSERDYTVTAFAQFKGGREHFGRNTRCTESTYNALTRIVSPREGEEVLRWGEGRLIANLVQGHDCLPQSFKNWVSDRGRRLQWEVQASWAQLQWPRATYTDLERVPRHGGEPALARARAGAAEACTRGAICALAAISEGIGPSHLQRALDGVDRWKSSIGLALERDKYTVANWLYSTLAAEGVHLKPLSEHRQEVAAVAHLKRRLKMAMVAGHRVHNLRDSMVAVVDLNEKDEPVKVGKHTRLTAALGKGSEAAAMLPNMLKACLDGLHTWEVVGDDRVVVVELVVAMKPTKAELGCLFQWLDDARRLENTVRAVVHSDDAVLSCNIDGVAWTGNIDISGCDRSNRVFMHTVLHALYARFSRPLADALIEQCRRPARIRNPANWEESFVFYPNGRGGVTQYSGATSTTAINTLASSLLVGAVAGALARGGPTDIGQSVVAACQGVGYTVTIKPCDRDGEYVPELMEFLRHSPAPETGGAYLSPAAIFRSLCTMTGIITTARLGFPVDEAHHLLDPGVRLRRVGSMVVAGLKHEPDSTYIRALRRRFDESVPPEEALGYSHSLVDGAGPQGCIDRAITRRYGLTADDLEDLARHVLSLVPGRVAHSWALAKMYHVDYGLALPDPGETRRATATEESWFDSVGWGA